MPVPTLSLDLVRRIVDHLEADHLHCSTTCREAGQTLALVCKSWRPIGRALVWRIFFVALDEENLPRLKSLVEAGVGRPLIKCLHLYDTKRSAQDRAQGTVMQYKVSGAALEVVKTFVAGCTSLESLIFKVFDTHTAKTTIEAVLSSVSSPYFEHLFLGVALYKEFDAATFFPLLARLPPLRKFDGVLLVSSVAAGHLDPAQGVTLNCQTVELDFPSSLRAEGSMAALRGLAGCLNSSTLRKCLVHITPQQTSFVSFLASCPNLAALRLAFEDSVKIREALPSLHPILPRFSGLKDLQFDVKAGKLMEETASLPSPAGARAFLAALPRTLNAILLTGVFFHWSPDDFLPSLPIEHFQAFLDIAESTLLCFGTDGGGRVERAMVAKVKLPGAGEAVWCRLC